MGRNGASFAMSENFMVLDLGPTDQILDPRLQRPGSRETGDLFCE